MSIIGVLLHSPDYRTRFHDLWGNVAGTSSPSEVFGPDRQLVVSKVMAQTGRTPPPVVRELVGEELPWVREAYDHFTASDEEWFETYTVKLLNRFKQYLYAQEMSDAAKLMFEEVESIDGYISRKQEKLQSIAVGGQRLKKSPLASDRVKNYHKHPVVLVPTRTPLDPYVGGLDFTNGDWWVISGREKNGKTRLVMNILIRLMEKLPSVKCTWISTEPNSSPEKVSAGLVAMLASREPLERNEVATGIHQSEVMALNPPPGWESRVSLAENHDMLRRLRIYGPLVEDGDASNLWAARALALNDILYWGSQILVVDNYQQFQITGTREEVNKDYDRMVIVVPAWTSLMKYHIVQFGISQFSRSGEMRGGGGLEDRLSTALSCRVDHDEPGLLHVGSHLVRNAAAFEDLELTWDATCGWLFDRKTHYGRTYENGEF